ncbi:MAG: hypothetical protein C4315_12305 [Chloroflexota bacterium]
MKSAERLAVLALVLGVFGARVYRLDFQPLWFDEGYTLYFATLPWASASAGGAEPHPPLYFLLFKLWAAGTGFGDFSSRYLSVLFGALHVPLAWALGRRLGGGPAGGLLAAVAVAFNPFLWSHAREARMYSLVPAVALGFGLGVVGVWQEPEVRRYRWLVGVTLLAGLYTHYFFSLFALAPAVGLALYRPALRPAVVLPGVLFLPWVVWAAPDFLQGAGSRGESYQPLRLLEYAAGYLRTVGAGEGCRAPCLQGSVGVALLLIGAVAALTRAKRPAAILWAGVLVALGLGFLLQLKFPFGGYVRLQSPTIPLLLTLTASALPGAMGRRPLRVLVTGLFVAGLILTGLPTTLREYRENLRPLEDYRPIARWLAAAAWPEDLVLCDFPWQVGYFLAYMPEPRPKLLYPPNPFAGDPPFRRKTEVWYPAYQALGGTGGGGLEGLLRDRLVIAENRWFGSTRLLRFAPLPAQTRWGRATGSDQTPRLVSWTLPAAPVDAGRTAVVTLEWTLGTVPPTGLKTFVHLATADEAIVSQADVPLEGQAGRLRVGLSIPAGTPAGEYRVWAGLYRADGGERLEPGPGATPDRRLPLGTITVGRPEYTPQPRHFPDVNLTPAEPDLGPYRIPGLSLLNLTTPQANGWVRPGDLLELRVYLAGSTFSGRLRLEARADGWPVSLAEADLEGCYPPFCRVPLRVVIPAEIQGTRLRLVARLASGPVEAEIAEWTVRP